MAEVAGVAEVAEVAGVAERSRGVTGVAERSRGGGGTVLATYYFYFTAMLVEFIVCGAVWATYSSYFWSSEFSEFIMFFQVGQDRDICDS